MDKFLFLVGGVVLGVLGKMLVDSFETQRIEADEWHKKYASDSPDITSESEKEQSACECTA